jgi:integrase
LSSRTGFFQWNDFVTFPGHLPPHLRGLFELAYITGWRVRSELLSRRWRHVDFSGHGCLRLEPGEAKDARDGREFPFTDWMRKVLEDQRQYVRTVERQTGEIIPSLPLRCRFLDQTPDSDLQSAILIGSVTCAVQVNRVCLHWASLPHARPP